MAKQQTGTFTKAALTERVSRFQHDVTATLCGLVRGMWNPCFCASDGRAEAEAFIQALRDAADDLEEAVARKSAAST